MRRAEIVGAIISTIVGLAIVSQAAQLEYWMQTGPGPGFVPLWAGVAISLAGIVLLFQVWRSPRSEAKAPAENQVGHPGMAGIAAALTVLAALGMNFIGFAATSFLFMAVLTGLSGSHRPTTTIGIAAGVTVVFLLVFKWGLQVPLPTGFLGI